MRNLQEESFSAINDEVKNGRLTLSGMRGYLIGLFFLSGILVGVSLFVANASTIGWNTLSTGWHRIYYIEAVLFGFHLLILLLCLGNNGFSQKLLSIGMVLFTYKAALDPFLPVLMFSKDEGNYHLFLPLIIVILISGFVLHIIILIKWIKSLKQNKEKSTKKRGTNFIGVTLVLFPLITLTTIITKNGLLGDYDLLFGTSIMTIIYLGLLIAACEFIIATYCIFRFPSFSVKKVVRK